MILADTSVWIDHLRHGDDDLAELLRFGSVACHPWVIGELALGNLRQREQILDLLHALPKVSVATDDEVLAFIGREPLHGRGVGYVDVHLLAATALTSDTSLWTRDKRLSTLAGELGLQA